MIDDVIFIQKILASIIVGYLLGSIPFAHIAARIKGIDIFSTGSHQAGTANVYWNISRRIGLLVFACDVAKGALAVTIAHLLGIPITLALIAGAAAILGHWKSLFTGFKGGDGMATLIGITVTLTPILALLCVVVGFATVILSWKSTFRSAVGVASCFSLLVFLSFYLNKDQDVILGLAGIAVLVLFHNLIIKKRISGHSPKDDLDDLEADDLVYLETEIT
ncbi:MAG: glycerol-3-phosphate acyltransferase [Chloroflexota bacterium]|nr:glycerol-3-phosphate acyltransferase [Chloroflexota bacterium]